MALVKSGLIGNCFMVFASVSFGIGFLMVFPSTLSFSFPLVR